jgi:hypothetical protein
MTETTAWMVGFQLAKQEKAPSHLKMFGYSLTGKKFVREPRTLPSAEQSGGNGPGFVPDIKRPVRKD